MGKIFYLMGKSASGKDTLYALLKNSIYELKTVVLYTTRPKREGEEEGVQYHFIDAAEYKRLLEAGKVIEHRDYDTVYGIWSYMTVDDGQIDLLNNSYLMIGTLESYNSLRAVYGDENMAPLYITVDDGTRLQRALDRERQQSSPKYAEMCRRFLADEADFAPDKLQNAGIKKAFVNEALDETYEEISSYIKEVLKEDGMR
ncbi:MAG: guanylate kinase [Lachnospiraceae bacterium]|nr:guanylate kinase [Lachnospiraceae bacterium]